MLVPTTCFNCESACGLLAYVDRDTRLLTETARYLALVATTGGALPEVVGTDGETGLLVPPDDPGALAVAIGRVLDHHELRRRLGAAGRQRVLGRFTWQVTAAGTAAEYRALLGDQAGSGPSRPDVIAPPAVEHQPTEALPC